MQRVAVGRQPRAFSRCKQLSAQTMRVVVTGSGGWIGRALVERLATSGIDVVGLTRADGDLAVPAVFAELVGDGNKTTVIHLAASLDRAGTSAADERQWRDTFLAGRHVIQESTAVGVRHIIAAGSMEELGSASGALTTTRTARPSTTYGLCKALVREVARFEARRRPVRIDWFRPTVVYGPGQRGPMLVPALCNAAVRGERLAVTDGRQQRDFLFIDDLLEWLCMALDKSARGFVLHHIGTGEATAVADVTARIESGFPGTTFDRGGRDLRRGEPPVQVAAPNGSSIREWRPRVNLEEGLERTIAWWRSNRA